MTWAQKRQLTIIGIILGALLILGSIGTASYVYLTDTSSCFDALQNGDERGIDCGGSCERICEADVRTVFVEFAQYVGDGPRADIVAQVTNPNTNADVFNATYTAELFTSGGDRIAIREGVVHIPARSTATIFVQDIAPNVPRSRLLGARAVVTLDNILYVDGTPLPKPTVESFRWNTTGSAPVLSVTITGDLDTELLRVPLTAIAFDEGGRVLAASRSVIDRLPRSESRSVFFTWSEQFPSEPVRTEFYFDIASLYAN